MKNRVFFIIAFIIFISGGVLFACKVTGHCWPEPPPCDNPTCHDPKCNCPPEIETVPAISTTNFEQSLDVLEDEHCENDIKANAGRLLQTTDFLLIRESILSINAFNNISEPIVFNIEGSNSQIKVYDVQIIQQNQSGHFDRLTAKIDILDKSTNIPVSYTGAATRWGKDIDADLKEISTGKSTDNVKVRTLKLRPLGSAFRACHGQTYHVLTQHEYTPSQLEYRSPQESFSQDETAQTAPPPNGDWVCKRDRSNLLTKTVISPTKRKQNTNKIIFRALLNYDCKPDGTDGSDNNSCSFAVPSFASKHPIEHETEFSLNFKPAGKGKAEDIFLSKPFGLNLEKFTLMENTTDTDTANMANWGISAQTFVDTQLDLLCSAEDIFDPLSPEVYIFGMKLDSNTCSIFRKTSLGKSDPDPYRYLDRLKFHAVDMPQDIIFYGSYKDKKVTPCPSKTEPCPLHRELIFSQAENTVTKINKFLGSSENMSGLDIRQNDVVVNVMFQPFIFDSKVSGVASNIGHVPNRNWVVINRSIDPVVLTHELAHIFGGTHGYKNEADGVILNASEPSLPAITRTKNGHIATLRSSPAMLEKKFKEAKFTPQILPIFSEEGASCTRVDSDPQETVTFCLLSKGDMKQSPDTNSGKHCKAAEYYLRGMADALGIEKPIPKYKNVKYPELETKTQQDSTTKDLAPFYHSARKDICKWIDRLPKDQLIFLGGRHYDKENKNKASLKPPDAYSGSFLPKDFSATSHAILVIGSADDDDTPDSKNLNTAKNRAKRLADDYIIHSLNKNTSTLRICYGEDVHLPVVNEHEDTIAELQNGYRYSAAYLYPNQ